jgi:hypothetical protein
VDERVVIAVAVPGVGGELMKGLLGGGGLRKGVGKLVGVEVGDHGGRGCIGGELMGRKGEARNGGRGEERNWWRGG